MVKFLGRKVTARGIPPDPDKAERRVRISMPSDVSQLRPVLGGLTFYRAFVPNMVALTRPLNFFLLMGVKYVFTPGYADIVRKIMDKLASPDVLAFPNYDDAIAGVPKFRMITDASTDG